MIPLRVTATLAGQVQLRDPIALDGLLAWAVCLRDAIPPAVTPAEFVPVEVPLAREPGGRFHLASLAEYAVETYAKRYLHRRFPFAEAMGMAPSITRLRLTAGPAKSYRIPTETAHLCDDALTWWCVGDADEIRALLALVGYVGKKRSVGLGKVARWDVVECETWPGFPVLRDGKPLRPLPEDWPGLAVPGSAYRRLTYPYWLRGDEVFCAVPEAS